MMKNHAQAAKGSVQSKVKKTAFGTVCVLLLLSLVNASVWEGAAAVSSGGELPDSGFYVATNSFPRNTIVDITNLETGKTVRGIVAAGLDSPGLLAVVSRESADAVGLQSRSIGRIRMIQPADPIAFSRFGEESLRSGDPDYDPEAALETYRGPSVPDEIPPVIVIPHYPPADAAKTPPVAEKAAESGAPEVTEQPEEPAVVFVAPPIVEETPFREEPPAVEPDVPVVTEKQPEKAAAEPAAKEPAEVDSYFDPVSAETVIITAVPEGKSLEEAEVVMAEAVPEPDDLWAAGEASLPEEKIPYLDAESVITLVPTEERPPVVEETPPVFEEPPIRSVNPLAPAYNVIPGVFSIPSVGELESGKYYLQLGAYSKTEAVEFEITKIEKNLPLAVQCTGSADRPIYRILVGPVNHGESGALLRRFRGSGYSDAFIRRGE